MVIGEKDEKEGLVEDEKNPNFGFLQFISFYTCHIGLATCTETNGK
jgi:hypothetical protein